MLNENEQRKVKESKVKEINKKEYIDFFESVWLLYPKKEGKGSISDKKKKELFALNEEIIRSIDRYKIHINKHNIDYKFIKMGSTFFNTGYIDYLDKNYMQQEQTKKQTRSGVNDDVPNPRRRDDY